MSKIKFTVTEYSKTPVIIVNGRNRVYTSRITEIAQTRPGHFHGVAQGSPFHIEGGRAAGGSPRDWFVSWDGLWTGYIGATSLTEAINLIESV